MRSATKKKLGKDPAYLVWIRTLPCVCCPSTPKPTLQDGDWRWTDQASPTEAAHVGERGLSQKCPDRQAIPLCAEHHREDRFSAHRLGKTFWEHYGLNKNTLIAQLNAWYDEGRSAVA